MNAPDGCSSRTCRALGFNAADQLGDAAILGERLVVEEPTQLLGEVGDGALYRIARFQPVAARSGPVPRRYRLVYSAITCSNNWSNSSWRADDIRKSQNAAKLTPWSGWKSRRVRRTRRPAEIRGSPARWRSVRAPAIESAEVVLHLPEIAEQIAGGGGELLVAVAQRGVVQQTDLAAPDLFDLGVDVGPPLFQRPDAFLRIGLRALHHLAQQLEHGQQSRLGTHKLRWFSDSSQVRAFSAEGPVVMRLVGVRG